MSSKIDNLHLNYKIWLETSANIGVLGDKKCELHFMKNTIQLSKNNPKLSGLT